MKEVEFENDAWPYLASCRIISAANIASLKLAVIKIIKKIKDRLAMNTVIRSLSFDKQLFYVPRDKLEVKALIFNVNSNWKS